MAAKKEDQKLEEIKDAVRKTTKPTISSNIITEIDVNKKKAPVLNIEALKAPKADIYPEPSTDATTTTPEIPPSLPVPPDVQNIPVQINTESLEVTVPATQNVPILPPSTPTSPQAPPPSAVPPTIQ